MTRHVEPSGAFGCKESRILACHKHTRQYVGQLPRISLGGNEIIEFLDHFGRIISRGRINGYHTRSISHAEYLLARKLPVYEARESGEEIYLAHMLLAVKYGLIQMRYAPSQRNVVHKQLAQLGGSLGCVGITPRAERYKNLPSLLKGI